eukprot:TRINITY_DN8693_c0_g1_i1.p1 TRINITY_DN8693_c0_g1~~TRINITY_DN8693_c0_g1_i1.p1  ORF type:complete len:819 (+),score=195.47 TRINITY_DN8693_c0_g1_i1:89-2545(+)
MDLHNRSSRHTSDEEDTIQVDSYSLEKPTKKRNDEDSIDVDSPDESKESTQWDQENGIINIYRFERQDTKNLFSEEDYYDDFDTIDWLRDSTRDRRLRGKVEQEITGGNKILKLGKKLFYAMQAWIILSLIAVLIGVIAGMIDMGVQWLGDVRFGFCSGGYWINSKLCCREFSRGEWDFCSNWKTWSGMMGVKAVSPLGFTLNYFFYVFFSCGFATIAAIFVKVYSRWAAGSGIPEVKTILGGFVIQGFTGTKTLLIKSIGLVLSVSSGMNCGKEGPLVHLSTCCAELCSKLFGKYSRNQGKKRELFSAAAAAGVSVAFGAPIGGVLFSLEEVSYYFPHKTLWRSFYCAALAAIVLSYMNPLHTGKLVLFQVTYTNSWKSFEMIPFFVVAVIGGLIGAFFIKMNVKMSALRKSKLAKYQIQEVMAVATITAIIHFINPYMRSNSGEIIGSLFSQCDPTEYSELCDSSKISLTVGYLLLAAILRLVLTIFTFGLKVPAGIFIPSLVIGASYGRAIGMLVKYVAENNRESTLFSICAQSTDCVTPGVYALVGAAATLGGVTRMTVSLVVIMFELTGELSYMLPLIMAVMVSKWVADAFNRDGIYDQHILLNSYPFLENKREYRFSAVAYDVMTQDGLRALNRHGNTVGSLSALLKEEKTFTGYPVVNNQEERKIEGYISRMELRQALEYATKVEKAGENTPCFFKHQDITRMTVDKQGHDVSSVVGNGFVDLNPYFETAPLQVTPETHMNVIFEMFKKLGLRYVLVVERGELVGIITKKDVLQHVHLMYHKRARHFVQPADVYSPRSIKRVRLPSTSQLN